MSGPHTARGAGADSDRWRERYRPDAVSLGLWSRTVFTVAYLALTAWLLARAVQPLIELRADLKAVSGGVGGVVLALKAPAVLREMWSPSHAWRKQQWRDRQAAGQVSRAFDAERAATTIDQERPDVSRRW